MKKLILLLFAFSFSHSLFSQTQNSGADTYASTCGPIVAVCYPQTLSGGLGIGITYVGLNLISNTSGIPPQLEDFTCTDSTWLDVGVAYNFEVHTGTVYEESVKAWIDFSNDGAFDASEIVYQDSALIFMHQGLVTVPTNAVNTFIPIRMRIGTDASGNPPVNGCSNVYYGQYEDYTIYYGLNIGITEKEKNNSVTISPNPFHDNAKLEIRNSKSAIENCELKIYNTMGALVLQSSFPNLQSVIISRERLVDGLYYYELRTPHSELIGNGKFVIE